MDQSHHPRVVLIPFQHNILETLSHRIIDDHRDSLPDLTHVTVLLSDIQAASQLRQQLLVTAQQHGFDALLGPHIQTLPGLIGQQYLPDVQVVGNQARELILVEALLDYPDLYGAGSPWLLASNLLELFDELTRHHIALPDSIDDFIEHLGQAYGLPDTSHTALGREAVLVHTLWQAMQKQLQGLNLTDVVTTYLMRLAQSLKDFSDDGNRNNNAARQYYLAGLFDFIPAEIQWINTLLTQNRLTLITQAECTNKAVSLDTNASDTTALKTEPDWLQYIDHPITRVTTDSAYSFFLQQTYAFESRALINRATDFSSQHTSSPIQSGISTFAACSDEEEALAVDLQIRLWLIEGRQQLAIVTDNRRLARRVRALLERANVALHDTGGWTLSTTSAASVVERWLETVEQNFHYQPLLDFLKSPFVCFDDDRKQHLSSVYRFEKDIVIHENVASDMQRYLTHIDYRSKRLDHDRAGYYDDIVRQLTTLQQAASPLQQLLTGKHKPEFFIETLQQSLTLLAVTQSLTADDAGQRIIEELQKLILACEHTHMTMDWAGFRYWLGDTLERYNFLPQTPTQNTGPKVQLLGLAQSDCQQFDGIVIAAAEQEFLPGSAGSSPFFNDAVRTRLGIPPLQQQRDKHFAAFRRLLGNGHLNTKKPGILITRRHSQNDEEISPSPWLEALQTFHFLAYDDDLTDTTLPDILQHPNSAVQIDERELPSTIPEHPSTPVPAELIPEAISATASQTLVNCPYQFFAAVCLKLSAPDTVREQMEKDEYGQRVHLCLEAFHKNIPDLPGPFNELITAQNHDTALTLLNEISRKVFSRDIEDNFLHRGWLRQWLEQTPLYISWQMKREETWRVNEAEHLINKVPLSKNLKLRGILDRIDHDTQDKNRIGIIDYKTGKVPAQADVDNGEAVQLPYYALLAEKELNSNDTTHRVSRVEYLGLDRDKKKFGSKVFLEGEQLGALSDMSGQRLNNVMQSLHDSKPVPAWGDAGVCKHCKMMGLCRKQLWDTKSNESHSG